MNLPHAPRNFKTRRKDLIDIFLELESDRGIDSLKFEPTNGGPLAIKLPIRAAPHDPRSS